MEFASLMLEHANVNAADLDLILLAGGLSHIPHITELLKKTFRKNICCQYLPEDAVAKGAARWAYLLQKNNERSLTPERDDLPLNFWIPLKDSPAPEVFMNRQSNGNYLLPITDETEGAREEKRQISKENDDYTEENNHRDKESVPLSTGGKNCYQDDVKFQYNNDGAVTIPAENTHSVSEATATVKIE